MLAILNLLFNLISLRQNKNIGASAVTYVSNLVYVTKLPKFIDYSGDISEILIGSVG